jgi:hypothetical protein
VAVEYIAAIRKDDYRIFRMIITTELPDKYEVWLQALEGRKRKTSQERRMTVEEVEVTPIEFGNYCRGSGIRDFNLASLDSCARAKASTQPWRYVSRHLHRRQSTSRPSPT